MTQLIWHVRIDPDIDGSNLIRDIYLKKILKDSKFKCEMGTNIENRLESDFRALLHASSSVSC